MKSCCLSLQTSHNLKCCLGTAKRFHFLDNYIWVENYLILNGNVVINIVNVCCNFHISCSFRFFMPPLLSGGSCPFLQKFYDKGRKVCASVPYGHISSLLIKLIKYKQKSRARRGWDENYVYTHPKQETWLSSIIQL